MDIYLQRDIHPIGQGGFYTEKFYSETNKSDLSVVYDCGTATAGSEKILKDSIDNAFDKEEEIDIVFVSHFDKDHVNGMEYLLDRCIVKKIILPLISESNRVILRIYYQTLGVSPNDMIMRLLNKDYDDIRETNNNEDLQFIEVEEVDEGTEEITVDPLEITNPQFPPVIQSGQRLVYNKLKVWEYIPFNFKSKDRHRELLDALKNCRLKDEYLNKPEEIMKDEKNRKKVRDIFNNQIVSGNINENSQVVYSGNTDKSYIKTIIKGRNILYNQFNCINCYQGRMKQLNKAACIYMGDYNAKKVDTWNEFESALNRYFSKVGLWQIPHHGSVYNYNEKIAKQDTLHFFMSAGANRQQHPSQSVVIDLLCEGKMPYIVTEEKVSRIIQLSKITY